MVGGGSVSSRTVSNTTQSPLRTEALGLNLEYVEYEPFWVKALADTTPGVLPLSLNLKKTNHLAVSSVACSKIETSLVNKINRIYQNDNCVNVGNNPVLLPIVLMYLYRLNNYQNFSVTVSNQWLYKNKANFKDVYVSQVPLLTDFNETISFKSAFQKTEVTMNQLQTNKTYAKDIVLRYPELAACVEHNLISIIVVEDLKQIQPSEVETLTIFINQEGTEFSIYSKKDAFPDSVNTLISNMSTHIRNIVQNVAYNLDVAINDVSILSEQENHKILLDWKNTNVTFKNNFKPIHYFFEQQVLQTPNHVAVIFENKSLTYFELNQKANKIAQYLTGLGVLPDSLIGICAKRSLEMVIGILGILKAGCAYLPLDPNYPAERLSYLLTDSQASIVLVDAVYPNLKTANSIEVVEIREILTNTDVQHDINVNSLVTSENLAYVIYTSGTTGEPKGVSVTHRSLVNHMLWMLPKFNFTENDIFLQKTPFSFDASIWEFFAPLLCGGKLILSSNGDPADIYRLIKKHKVTILQLVPSLLKVFLEENEFLTCDSLKQVFVGGEALVSDTVSLFHERMQAKLHNLYGPTETTIQVTSYSYNRDLENTSKITFIGKPISNVQVYVLDKCLNHVPIGVPGELYIGGACLARGYLNREDLTQSRFIQSPFSEDKKNRLYKTGDMVRLLPDGNLEYIARMDDQIKLHGYRIELGEIEANLLQHEGVRECAVVIQERVNNNNSGNPTDKGLVAYYVKHLDLTNSDTEDFVRTWETFYQSEYLLLDINNFKQNTGGWNSSYTDEAIAQDDIQEWVNATASRIQQYNPKTILEIGSGSGLILFNMLDSCCYYYATDFSKNVINYTKNVVDKFGYSEKVSTIACSADKVPYDQIARPYDTVILNSVIQYFPSLEYLETVITQTILNMPDFGQVFIGDIRDFRLLKCFHCSVQRYKQKKITKIDIDRLSLRDKELLISPEYFVSLKNENKDISHIEIMPKLGTANHEMNNYRYDVVLHIRKNNKNSNDVFLNEKNFIKVRDFEKHIESNMSNDYICLKYPNKRILQDYLEYNKIFERGRKVHDINRNDFLTMAQIFEFAALKNRDVKFFIDVNDPLYFLVVVFKNNIGVQRNFFVDYTVKKPTSKCSIANKPLVNSKLLQNQFSNELKAFLSSKLPSYMVPTRYVPLERLPLNNNGKLDRKALIEAEFTRSEGYVGPRNDVEIQNCKIWAEVLGLPEDKIGIRDDFFYLGGHSLSALRTLSLINSLFLIKLPTRTLFDYPTIEKLSGLIQTKQQNLLDNVQQNSTPSPIIALQKNGFKTPLFLIHPIGGTIFWYKLISRNLGQFRPIYAIQDPGIDAEDLLFNSVQEMASFYLKAIQEIQPSGPYLLAGASFGATVSIEIASQLLKAGEKVNFIGLLDGWPVYSKKFWEKEFFEQLMLQQFQRMGSQFIRQGINDLQFLLKLQQHRMLMLRYYKIPLVNAKLTFFKAEELWPVFKEMVLPLNCWQPYSSLPVDIHLVPGNHETMFWEPQVQTLAKKINLSLDKIEAQKPSAGINRISLLKL